MIESGLATAGEVSLKLKKHDFYESLLFFFLLKGL